MARKLRFLCPVVLALASALTAGPAAQAGCAGDATGGNDDTISIRRDGALLQSGMRGCGTVVETRIGRRKLSIVGADLLPDWDIESPLDDAGPVLRFSQTGFDLWRGEALRWIVRASTAESLSEQDDLERFAGEDMAWRGLGSRGVAMASILRSRDGRLEWLSELAGAGDDGTGMGNATRHRLRARLLGSGDVRLDASLRHQRAEPGFRGAATALEQDRDVAIGGLTLRLDDWTGVLERYVAEDNLDGGRDETREWDGWTGSLRYRIGGAAAWLPRSAELSLDRVETTRHPEDGGTGERERFARATLLLRWPGPQRLRLEGIHRAELDEPGTAGEAGEAALGWERGLGGADWTWYLGLRAAHLEGDGRFSRDSETGLRLRLGATPAHGPALRLGLEAGLREVAPRDEDRYTDARLQARASLRF